MALLVHILLLVALTVSVQWKHQTDTPVIEAEMWSSVALQAAAKPVEAPPPPPPSPEKQAPEPDARQIRDAQIAIERQKAKEKALAERQQALQLAERQRKDELKKRELEKQVQDDKQKRAKEKEAQDKRDKLDAEKKLAAQEKIKKQEADARHKANMDRIMGLAGATGDAKATGTALKSSAPSAGYAGRIAGRVKPNIVFTDDVPGNPEAEVEIRTAPDGTIVGTPKLVKSSGVKSWDEAVVKALLKTEVLPRDTDGRVPPVIIMVFSVKNLKP